MNIIFRHLSLPIASFLLLQSLSSEAQLLSESEKLRSAFLSDLSGLLIGKNEPFELDHKSFRGVLLAPPGTAISPLITSFDAQSSDFQSVAQIEEAISEFDKPLIVESGFANVSSRSLSAVWEKILQNSMPSPPLGIDSLVTNADIGRWLFRQPDKIDAARGVRWDREPSEYLLRFREFDSTFRLLVSAEQKDDGAWRLNPRLSGFSNTTEAKVSILGDWVKYGYKQDIEHANQLFDMAVELEPWSTWANAKANYDDELVTISAQRSVCRSYLFPPPSSWMTMGTWLSVSIHLSDGKVAGTFQLARIRINRPWFDMDSLLDGRLKLNHNANFDSGSISDGNTPTILEYPKGMLAVYPEELIIVRQIRFASDDLKTSHPLGVFAYPDTINLLGYVVRTLPKLPN